MRFLRALWQHLPRFKTADYALKRVGRSSLYDIVCCMDDVKPGERFDAIATKSSLVIGRWGVMPRQVGPIRPFVNPHAVEVCQ